jgi:hypothetical protein
MGLLAALFTTTNLSVADDLILLNGPTLVCGTPSECWLFLTFYMPGQMACSAHDEPAAAFQQSGCQWQIGTISAARLKLPCVLREWRVRPLRTRQKAGGRLDPRPPDIRDAIAPQAQSRAHHR